MFFSVSFCISVMLSLAYRHECVPSRDKGGSARTQRRVREEKKDLEQKRPPVSHNVAYRTSLVYRALASFWFTALDPDAPSSPRLLQAWRNTEERPGARPSFLVWLTPYLTFLAIPLPHAGIKTRRKGKPPIFHAPCKSCGVLKCRWALLHRTLAWTCQLWECHVPTGKCESLRDGRAQGLLLRLVLYRSQTVDRESYPRPVIEKALHSKSGKHCLVYPVFHPVPAQTGPLISNLNALPATHWYIHHVPSST